MRKEKQKLLKKLLKLQDDAHKLGCDKEITYHIASAVQILVNDLNTK